MRLMVQIGTIDTVLRGKYFLPDSRPVALDKKALERASLQSRMYQTGHVFKKWPHKESTEFMVIEGIPMLCCACSEG